MKNCLKDSQKLGKRRQKDLSFLKIELRASTETLKGGASIRSGLYLFDFIDTTEAIKISFK